MPTSTRFRLAPCSAALMLLFSASVWSADKGKPEENPYKLQLRNAGDYRLLGHTDTAAEAALPATLAGKPYAREIEAAAKASKLDPVLVHALIHAESRHRKDAISPKGAIGLMQLMPATAQRFGVDQPDKVPANLRAGTRYLRLLLDRYDGRLDLALAAYNAGEGAVTRYGGIPPYAETQAYVPAVLENYTAWRKDSHVHYMDGTVMEAKPAIDARMMR